MSEEHCDDRTCGQMCKMELNDLCCKPKARCFKGLAILSGIYCLGCALMLMIIPPVVNAHGVTAGSPVDDRLHSMKVSSLILMCIFFGVALVSLMACKVYEKKEKRHSAIVQGDLMGGGNFEQFADEDFHDGRHVEER